MSTSAATSPQTAVPDTSLQREYVVESQEMEHGG
eukprot:COSAG04_NODE_17137_length_478_cov_0.810026_2_plen_33_part_01